MPRAKSKSVPNSSRGYTRRSEEERIADLETKIQNLKRRAAAKAAKKDPTLRHVAKAIKAIDRAVDATSDAATRKALEEARTTLSACLQLHGESVPRNGRTNGALDPDAVLAYIRGNPGQRSEQIASALHTETALLRRSMKKLIDAGSVHTKGERRGMQYWAV